MIYNDGNLVYSKIATVLPDIGAALHVTSEYHILHGGVPRMVCQIAEEKDATPAPVSLAWMLA